MANIAITKTGAYTAEDRSYVYADFGVKTRGSATLDVAKFDRVKHYPTGYIKSGTVLGKITATKLYGPYDPAATDGRETATGFLWNSTTVTDPAGFEAVPQWYTGFIQEENLPANSGLDDAAKVDLAAWFKFFSN